MKLVFFKVSDYYECIAGDGYSGLAEVPRCVAEGKDRATSRTATTGALRVRQL